MAQILLSVFPTSHQLLVYTLITTALCPSPCLPLVCFAYLSLGFYCDLPTNLQQCHPNSNNFSLTYRYGHIQWWASARVPGTTYPTQRQVTDVNQRVPNQTLTVLPDISPIAGSLTLHRLSMYIAGISMGVAILISATLIFLHATHLSRPAEQIKYVLRPLPCHAYPNPWPE